MRALLAVGLCLAGARGLAGQTAFQVELGGGPTRHQYTPESAALSVRPSVQWWGARERLDLGLVYSRDAAFRWNAGAAGAGALLRPLGPRVTMELGAEGWWTAHRTGASTTELTLRSAWHLDTRAVRWSLDAGAGYAASAGGGRGFGVLGWRGAGRLGPFELQGRVRQTVFAAPLRRYVAAWRPQYPVGGDTAGASGGDSLSTLRGYSDLGMTIGLVLAGTRLQAVLEQRLGRPEYRATAWHLEAERFLTRDFGLFASAGKTLSVLTSGLPARQYAAAGLKWAPGRRPLRGAAAAAPGRAFRVEPARPGWTRLLLRAPDQAVVVEVRADFTDWEPLPLLRADDGWWSLVRELAPGLYRLEVRVDGGPWHAPAGLPRERDDFNGEVGVLLVAPR